MKHFPSFENFVWTLVLKVTKALDYVSIISLAGFQDHWKNRIYLRGILKPQLLIWWIK